MHVNHDAARDDDDDDDDDGDDETEILELSKLARNTACKAFRQLNSAADE